ncbi:MAG TPA: epimerase, partial [Thermoanaerobaculia bacterium]|nr:epimerase [Thermoanaerobaculia bacterium]
FTYWVVRGARGGEVLAPGRPDRPIQLIDVRDLAEWIVRMLEEQRTGVYNATGLPGELTMERLLEACGRDASLRWVSDEFLLQQKVTPWTEMPLWIPEEAAPHRKGFMFINCDKALAHGLRFRPLEETIRDTLLAYDNHELKAGLDPARERELLRLARRT